MTKKKFLYNLSRASYQKTGKQLSAAHFWGKIPRFLIRIIPKFGPLKVLQLENTYSRTERMFEASFQHDSGSLSTAAEPGGH